MLEATGLLNLSTWPKGMRVIVRRERPHPGAQLRLTDAAGHRLTAFATNTAPGGPGRQLAGLELRHRRRARAEDRIRIVKDTGLTNLPLHDLAQNRIWCALIALACELTAWMQLLALAEHPARRWEPKRLRLRLFSTAGRLAHTGRRTVLHLSNHAPWAPLLLQAVMRLHALAAPGCPAASLSRRHRRPGPWNRHPPERPRAHCHAHLAESRREHRTRPVSLTAERHAKDPG